MNQYQLEEIIGHVSKLASKSNTLFEFMYMLQGSYGVVRRAVTGSNEVKVYMPHPCCATLVWLHHAVLQISNERTSVIHHFQFL